MHGIWLFRRLSGMSSSFLQRTWTRMMIAKTGPNHQLTTGSVKCEKSVIQLFCTTHHWWQARAILDSWKLTAAIPAVAATTVTATVAS